jgi:acyl-CoA thioesterase II
MAAAVGVERVSDFRFLARAGHGRQSRVFGGQLIAQALAAAGRTVPEGLRAHVLHATFTRAGVRTVPVEFAVDPVRDRGAFAHRRVTASQRGEQLMTMSASFHHDEPGLEYQEPVPEPPGPADLPSLAELSLRDARTRDWWARLSEWLPLDVRCAAVPGQWQLADDDTARPRQQLWLRVPGGLPADPLLHDCVLAYSSDLFLLTTAMAAHGLRHDDHDVFAVTLNHAMWFHGPARVDDWWLYEQEGIWSGAGRMLARGQLRDQSGQLLGTVTQEGLLRVRR